MSRKEECQLSPNPEYKGRAILGALPLVKYLAEVCTYETVVLR
jgi:hypothetical protein